MASVTDDFELIDHQEAILEPEVIKQLQSWLQLTDFSGKSSEFSRHLLSQTPGTGLWISDTQKFSQWHDSEDHGSLWIKGVPGSGKSVIAASMIEHLRASENHPVLFFFFRYIIAENRKPRSLIQDWLAQLLPYSARLQFKLQPLVGSKLDDISDEQLWEYLLLGLNHISKVWCVVDGLDEMEMESGTGSFLQRLNDLAIFRPNSVKLLMTSRPKQYLQSALKDASIVHINLEDDLVGKDIAAFVSYRLKSIVPGNENLQKSLQSTICSKSKGLFLYARLLLDQIEKSQMTLDVGRLAESLPIGLEEMYNTMLDQQAKGLKINTSLQVFLLEWVVFSPVILRLNQLASVLQLCFLSSIDAKDAKNIVRSSCSPLLEILEDESVQVIHHSFTEFLLNAERADSATSFPVLNSQEVHKRLGTSCLKYLKCGALLPNIAVKSDSVKASPSCKCEEEGVECRCKKSVDTYNYQEARLRYPFLEYAVKNWSYHASLYDVQDEEFFESINDFLNYNSPEFRRWLELEWSTAFSRPESECPSALHIAAFTGLCCYAESLPSEARDVSSSDADGKTPLHWACRKGHLRMCSFLLNHGAQPDAEDWRGVKPIHESARKNYAQIVRMLLESGVDPMTPKTRENHAGRLLGGERITKGETAVQYVCEQGHTETILAMLPFLSPEVKKEVLCESSRYGKTEAVLAVLQNSNLPLDAKFRGATALYLACQSRSAGCVEALLARGADVHLLSEWEPKRRINGGGPPRPHSKTPLHGLVSAWKDVNTASCQAILRMLLDAGADLEARDGRNETPLMNLIGERRVPTFAAVGSLLQAGALLSVTNNDGLTILQSFLKSSRDIEILELLFKHGANIRDRGRNDDTVLHTALRSYIWPPKATVDEVVKLLLAKGATPNDINDTGETPLLIAVRNNRCSLDVIKVLLDYSNEEARKVCLWSVGHRGAHEMVEFLNLILSTGISIDNRDRLGRTPLLSQTTTGAVKALIKCGAQLDATDFESRGLLHHYAHSSGSNLRVESLQERVDLGLDPLVIDKQGNTLLHEAVTRYSGAPLHVAFIERLLEYGISPNATNCLGRTALHLHIEEGSVWSSDNNCTRTTLLEVFQKGKIALDIDIQDQDGLSCLHLASMRSEVHTALLLRSGANPSLLSPGGRSIFHLACRARQSGIVGQLLSVVGTALVNQADTDKKTALHDACSSGRPESVYYLLKSGARIDAKDSTGRTALHSCAEFPVEQALWLSLEHRNPAAGQFIRDRFRPHAEKFSSYEAPRVGGIITQLIAAGADGHSRDTNGDIPVELAVKYDCKDMIYCLAYTLDHRQEIPLMGNFLPTLQATSEVQQQDSTRPLDEMILQELIRYPPQDLSFLSPQEMDWIMKQRKNENDVVIKDQYQGNSTLVLRAAEKGLTELVDRLGDELRYHSDPQAVYQETLKSNSKRYTHSIDPVINVSCSRMLPNVEMLELLVDRHHVDVSIRSLVPHQQYGPLQDFVEGGTALHMLAGAKYWWQLDAMKYLVNRGANIHAVNQKGETPLHIASRGNTFTNMGVSLGFWALQCVELLLDLGADPNSLDSDGLSCLNKASAAPDVMKLLLERGGDVCAGKSSPLFSAIEAQDLTSLTTLLDAGVSPDSLDLEKSCAVHYKVKNRK